MIRFIKLRNPMASFLIFQILVLDEDGVYWPTSEHYFQAQKFASKQLREKIVVPFTYGCCA